MYLHDSSTRPIKNLLPGINARTFWGENILFSLVTLDAHAVLPPHSHPHEQLTYMLDGAFDAIVGGEKYHVTAGQVLVIPGGVEHSVTVGDVPARVLDAFSPVREDLKY